jgi:hypothetical protein
VKIDPKAKCIHKYKHDQIHIYRESVFAIVGLLTRTQRGGRGKENDRVNNIIIHCIYKGRGQKETH